MLSRIILIVGMLLMTGCFEKDCSECEVDCWMGPTQCDECYADENCYVDDELMDFDEDLESENK